MTSMVHPRVQSASQADRTAMVRRAFSGPLLIAARDDDSAHGPLQLAELIARRDQVNAHVLTLVQPPPFTASLLLAEADIAALTEGRRQDQLARVRQRMHQTVGRAAHFSMSAELGSPSRAVANVARQREAELILVGLETLGATGRAATEDAALQVSRTSGVPVLAVPPDCVALPRRALVAMDFAEASVQAARAALLTLANGGHLTLAHVEPDLDFREMGKDGWGEIYAEGVTSLFARLVPELRVPGDIAVETTLVSGDPAAALLECGARGGFDLIAAGSRSAPWPDSDLTGSVSAALLRGAACPVLIAPPPEGLR